MSLLRRACRRALNFFYRPYVLARIARPAEARLLGRRFRTRPDVFHPAFFHSTGILARHVRSLDLAGRRVLDMGTGSGAIAVFAALRGARVTACDRNPQAVEAARENARLNGVEIEVLRSDLFAALDGRRFDLIGFNVPFYPKEAATELEAAFYAGPGLETVRRFAAGCRAHLAPGGAVVVVFSEDSGYERVVALFRDAGLEVARTVAEHRFFERFHVVWFEPAPAPAMG